MERVQANGISFTCSIDGAKGAPWVIFSNSLNTNLSSWDGEVARFGDRYRILRYNARGHDGSGAPPGPWELEDLASDVVALWDALGIERSHFVGLSIGGMTGQALALGWPDRIRSLVLADTRADFTGEFAQFMPRMIAQAKAEGLGPLIEAMPARWLTPDSTRTRPDLVKRVRDMVATNSLAGYVGCADAITRLDFMDRLSGIKLPTLLICGTQDLGTPVAGMREMQRRIAGARYVEIERAGHLSNIENPDPFDRALAEFLDAQPR
jgi:3-oxoadipate enol-lactonase